MIFLKKLFYELLYNFEQLNKSKKFWLLAILLFYLKFRNKTYKLQGKYFFETLGEDQWTSDVLHYPAQYESDPSPKKQNGVKKNGVKPNYSQSQLFKADNDNENQFNIDNIMGEEIKKVEKQMKKRQSVNNFQAQEHQQCPKVTKQILELQQQKDLTIIFIPGFPGIIKLYDDFLNHLHQQLNRKVNIYAIGYINLADNPKKDDRNFTLEENAKHKILFMQKLIKQNPKQKFAIIAHSMGSFISLKIIQNFSNPIILKGYFLYPAVLDFTETLMGKIAYIFYMKKQFFQIYRFCFWFNAVCIPKFLQRGVVSLFYGVKNAKIIVELGVQRNLYLFKALFIDYMNQNEQSGQKNELILKKLKKCVYQFSKNDFLIPLKHADDLTLNFPDVQCKVIPDMTHQFIAGHSESQAEVTGKQIIEDFPFLKK